MMFCNCSSLKDLPDISKWNKSIVININSRFKYFESLIKMTDISKCDISNITEHNFYLEGCEFKKPKFKYKK